MKIVILDGHTLNPGDLDWAPLKNLGELDVYRRTGELDIISRAEDADIIFTNKTILSGNTLNKLKKLRYIGVLATGYDIVDISSAVANNITVTNVPAYGAASVAQMCFAHILHFTNDIVSHTLDVRQGGWSTQQDFCYWLSPQVELQDKIMGIIGFGEIGRATARLAEAYGMKILIHTRTTPMNLPENYSLAELGPLLSTADFISLHCPLTEKTRHLINTTSLQLMKKSAILINASRGPLVDEPALAKALNNEKIGGAGLDVLSVEPATNDNPLLTARNCSITPHIAWATQEARARLLNIAVNNLQAFLQGNPLNRVA